MSSPQQVKDFLEALQAAASSSPSMMIDLTSILTANTITNRKDSVEFTDIQLLAYLSQFEEKNREEKDKMFINSKTKVKMTDGMALLTL